MPAVGLVSGRLEAPPRSRALRGGFALAATALAFWVLLLEPNPLHAARVFWDRTFDFQLDRDSPFSIWNWAEYPGYPDLSVAQTGAEGRALLAAAVAVGFYPRRKTPLQLAALTAFLLIGFEIVLTHWFYLYIPWFLPFVAFALLAPVQQLAEEPVEELAMLTRSGAGRCRSGLTAAVIRRLGPRRAASAAVLFVLSWALLHVTPLGDDQIIDTPIVPALTATPCVDGAGSVPRLLARVPAGRAAGVHPALARAAGALPHAPSRC